MVGANSKLLLPSLVLELELIRLEVQLLLTYLKLAVDLTIALIL